MIKNKIIKYGLALTLVSGILTGCSHNNGVMINASNASFHQQFEEGIVVSSKKVLLDDSNYATTMGGGALGGAAIGSIIGSKDSSKRAGKGAIIGAGVGALAGLVYNKATSEKEAYQIEVQMNNGNYFTAFVSENFQVGQKVNFVIRPDGSITNLDASNRARVK